VLLRGSRWRGSSRSAPLRRELLRAVHGLSRRAVGLWRRGLRSEEDGRVRRRLCWWSKDGDGLRAAPRASEDSPAPYSRRSCLSDVLALTRPRCTDAARSASAEAIDRVSTGGRPASIGPGAYAMLPSLLRRGSWATSATYASYASARPVPAYQRCWRSCSYSRSWRTACSERDATYVLPDECVERRSWPSCAYRPDIESSGECTSDERVAEVRP
jgi:hypothetical protein